MKVTLNGVGSLIDATTAQNTINNNNQIIEDAFDNTLSLDGTAPNQMRSTFDMNSNQIINLPLPATANSPARLVDIGNAPSYAAAAAASAALADADVVLTHADVVLTHADVVLTHADVVTTAANVAALSATSATSLLIGTGAKVFTIQAGKLFITGQFLQIASTANTNNFMHGQVTTYTGTTLTMNITDIGGSGTFADWKISISGTQGTQGPQGNTGPSGAVGITGTPTINQFATWNNATTVQGVSLTGLVKGNGASAPTAAVASTDYIAATTGSAIQKASSGGLTAATAGTDYLAPAAIGTTVQAFDAQLFSNIPQNSQSAAYGLVLTDGNKHIFHPSADTTARIWTIPANASVAYPVGTAVTFINQNAGGVITIAITTDTMRLAGAGTTGSRTLAANGMATAIKVTTTEWIISGTGLT